MTVVLNNGTLQVEKNEDIGKKRDSSDSGKESDTEEEIEERKDIEENSDCEDVYEDCEVYEEEEDIDECVNDYQEKSDYSWNYLQTIEEEEEELLEDEEEVEEEDSGNDSDLEKSELETFEQLEQMCEEEANKEEGGINADYVILIREECGGGNCECGGGGGGDYCYGDDDEDEDEEELQGLDLTPFDPPVEFVDQLTLSPPDGYKDYCIHRTSPGNLYL
ncbi:hypothetical protein O3M35_001755 [Rhynocoris fuscipes]|uniref:Uncharacterized protein n=1 Tax=Rhynocoris fuscipes TaxID=488301 RepID=A0AAW1CSM9_9HEMI